MAITTSDGRVWDEHNTLSLHDIYKRHGISHEGAVLDVFMLGLMTPANEWETSIGWFPRWQECEGLEAIVALGND